MGATIRDVAKQAGVSISTVSRVLNNTCPVHSDKQKAVEDAAKALGYSPHPAARSLLTSKTGGLGILLPFVSGEFFSEFLSACDEEAQKAGYFVLISTSHYSSADLNKALRGMDRRVDGLLIMSPLADFDKIDAARLKDAATVFVNSRTNGAPVDSVTFDNYGGMYAMTAHLLSNGHRRIGYIKGPEGTYDADERFRGYRNALQDTGMDASRNYTVDGGYTMKEGYEAAIKLMKLREKPTSIMASNDYAALGVIHALRELGYEVPKEVAVSGFDDIQSTQYSMPPLSTVHVPLRDLGAAATKLLIARIKNRSDPPPQQRTLPVQLVIRESTSSIGPRRTARAKR